MEYSIVTWCCSPQTMAFMAAKLGPADVSAHNIVLNMLMLLSALPYGGMNASTFRVGYHCGAGSVIMAKRVAYITITAVAVVGECWCRSRWWR
jgi:Na+-driven multidrug efflux pump